MVFCAFEVGISAAAKKFGTSRPTVRKWKQRYEKKGTKGLHNLSQAPHHIPHKTPKHLEETIIKHRNRRSSWGPVRLKEDFDLPISTAAIYRILKQNDLIKKHRRKHQRKNDLRKLKMKMRSFQKVQVDVKDLSDIPNYYYFKRAYDLPRYQYTARDVKSGMLYIAHARKNDCINAANFMVLLAEHLISHGIDPKKVSVQTDNGSEFIGNWKQRKPSLFTHLAEKVFKMKHYRIPPRRCTFNSDVESSHLRIEKDFYDLEEFRGVKELAINSFSYLLYFNLLRKNKAKFNKTSFEIVRDDFPGIKVTINAFSPVILDDLGFHYLKYISAENCGQTGNHLPIYPNA
jgi:transposase